MKSNCPRMTKASSIRSHTRPFTLRSCNSPQIAYPWGLPGAAR
jgi:hypothetical protein